MLHFTQVHPSATRQRLFAGASLIALAAGGALTAQPARAADVPTSYTGANGALWDTPGNWTNGVPNIGTPSAATVNNGNTVNTGGNDSTDTLAIGPTAGSAVTVSNNTSLTLGSSVVNQGTLSVSAGPNTTSLIVADNATVTLSGGGTLSLSNSANNQVYVNNSNGTLDNVDNTIQGSGNLGIGRLSFDNQASGLIDANQSTQLVLQAGGNGTTNAGTLRASNGGQLNILNSFVTQTSTGNVLATGAGSTVLLDSTTINHGTLTTTSGGTIATAAGTNNTLNNVTIAAGSTVTASNNTSLTLGGTIINQGAIAVTSTGNTTSLIVPDSTTTTLKGGGTVILSGQNVQVYVNNSSGQLTNVDNTIQGTGNVGIGRLNIDNQAAGLVDANVTGGTLTLQANAGGSTNEGTLRASNGGTLQIQGSSITQPTGTILAQGVAGPTASTVLLNSTTINGGTLTSTGGGVITTAGGTNSAIAGVTVSPNSTLTVANNSSLTLLQTGGSKGTTVNQGTILLNGGPNLTDLIVQDSTTQTLTGGGTVQLSNSANNRIFVNNSSGELVNVNNTIQGSGSLGIGRTQFDNQAAGVINADQSTPLILQSNGNGTSNEGLLEATAGGQLNIAGGSVTQSGTGGILSTGAGSNVLLTSTTINGGTLTTASGGAITTQAGTSNTLNTLTITQGSTLSVSNNSSVTLGGTITNKGAINVASTSNFTDLVVPDSTLTTLNGGGSVTLSGPNARIYVNNSNGQLTNVDNAIQGTGNIGIGRLNIDNQAAGLIDANSNGNTLTLQTNGGQAPVATTPGTSNEGLLRASNGGQLSIVGSSVTQTAGGAIVSTGTGSNVQLSNTTINGGPLTSTAGGTITTVAGQSSTLNGVSITAGSTVTNVNNGTLFLTGTINNAGTIANTATTNLTDLRIADSGSLTLTGGGTVTMSGANARLYANNGVGTLTNINNTIQGTGALGLGLITIDNQASGLIDANVATTTLTVQANGGGTNNAGTLRASNGGQLNIAGSSVTQTGGGNILATGAGSNVQLSNTTINGGPLTSTAGGTITTVGGQSSTLNGVSITAGSTVTNVNNGTLFLTGTINNAGTIANTATTNLTDLRIADSGSVTLTGGGTVTLSGTNGRFFANNGVGTLTNTDNTIQGQGELGLGRVNVLNGAAGTILANVSGAALNLNTNGSGLTNTGTLQASNTATLNVVGGPLTNFSGGTLTGGTYHADAGSTVNLNTAGISTNAATLILNGAGSQINTNAGAIETTLTTNAVGGSLQILGARNYSTALDLSNSGSVQLGGGTLAPLSLTNTGTGTITGFGALAPTNGTAVANAGSVIANGGTLTLATGIAGAGTLQVNAGATASFAGAPTANTVGTLAQNGTLALGNKNITVSADYTNANFGSGNSFNKTANVTGTGQILASGNVAQAITGAKVTNGTTASPTLDLGQFHTTSAGMPTAGATATFQIANTGTTGPALRGALQNTGITNPALSGSGVTAGNFGPITPGSASTPFTVSVAPTTAGALVGQSIHIANNFANVAEQTLAITGTGYNFAQATVSTSQPVNLGNFRVGAAPSTSVTIGNTAPSGAFTENLDGSAGATTGSATASGSFTALAAGSTSNAISVGLSAASAGAKNGTATVNFVSNAAGVDSLGNTALASQSIAVQGNAFRLATGAAATPVSAGNVHVGGTATATLSVTNTAANDGFSEKLDAAVSGTTGAISSTAGTVSLLGAGSTSQAITASLNTATAGAKSGTVGLNFASNGAGTTGAAATANGAGTVTVTGNVFNLASSSAIGTVNFGVLHTNTGTQSRALSITNTAATGGFSEGLDSSFGGYTNNGGLNVSTSGSISNLAAGATDSSSLQLSVSTAQAGTINGTVTVHQASNGTIDGLGNTALADQTPSVTGQVQATVTNLAQPVINTSQPVAFGNVRIGSAAPSQALSITNAAPTGGFSESLVASVAGTSGGVTASGGFGPPTAVPSLAPQATDSSHVVVGINTSVAGSKSGNATLDFKSDGTAFNGGTITDLGTANVAVTGAVYRLANPTLNTPAITLAARVGGTASAGVSVTNNSPDVFTEGLKASLAPAPAGFTSAGSIANLAAGGTDASTLRVSLNTATSGSTSGTQTVNFTSTGAGTTNAADLALTGGSVAVNGKVYQAAVAAVTPNPLAFGIVHVGDVVGAQSVAVANTASGALTDVLQGGFGTVSGPFTGSGSLGAGVAAGNTSTALTIGLNTSAAGVFSGSAGLNLVSHDSDLADLALTTSPLGLSATVNNYAVSGFDNNSGAAALTGSSNAYTLNFGTVTQGSNVTDSLFAANLATGPADLLAGLFNSTGGGFTINGLNAFNGLAAGGQFGPLSITFNTSQTGNFQEVIDLVGTGSNASGYSGRVADSVLTIDGIVNASGGGTNVPEPGSLALLASGLAGLFGLRRAARRRSCNRLG